MPFGQKYTEATAAAAQVVGGDADLILQGLVTLSVKDMFVFTGKSPLAGMCPQKTGWCVHGAVSSSQLRGSVVVECWPLPRVGARGLGEGDF